MNTKHFTKLLSLVTLALLFVSCNFFGNRNNNETETTEIERRRVRVEQVQMRPVEQVQLFTATVQADAVNNISGLPARINRILVDVGQTVRRGQALVQMDATNLAQQRTQVETLRRDFARFQELHAVGGISTQQLDQLRAQLDVATAQYNQLSENTTLVSPINGVVTARNFESGDMATGAPILTIQTINPVRVVINVPESQFTRVHTGMAVNVQLDAFGDEVFEGRVTLIYPTVDPLTRTFRTEVTVPNADMRIRPGMFARVALNFGDVERVVIPDRSVVRQPGTGDRFVFVVNADNTVSRHLVELGARLGDEFEVISGVEAGNRVVLDASGLLEGASVQIVD